MFKKILVANRGEIACRILKTARRMGLGTVAVFSEADRDALHVAVADEAVGIGPAPAAHSYLDIERILQACRETGADAVHPGYGFLAENAEFARRLEAAGVVFIGPPVEAIRCMGDKLAAKKLAADCGLNVIPGSTEPARDCAEAVAVAREINYPVILKAAAGGGGRGMRVARGEEECREAFSRAAQEAQAAFGDGRLFVERLLERPRHVEIQVLADHEGHVIHLGERECSLQRRHQKVIEEAPSPLLDDTQRDLLGRQAVALAQRAGYRSAGTVEFLVDARNNAFFLEMNTRLQVEHPVTELVTGLDLVELMIRIAAGQPLPLSQADVRRQGWAVEARVCAEDPCRNFLPSAGRLVRYLPPCESAQLRVDSGVSEGSEVSIHYDSLIAKVIAHGSARAAALEHLRRGLDEFTIRGVEHNLRFLSTLLERDAVREGRVSTHWITETFPSGLRDAEEPPQDPALLVAVAASIHRRHVDRAAQISGQLPGYERQVPDDWIVVLGTQHHRVEVRPVAGGHEVLHAGQTLRVLSDWKFGQPRFMATINGQQACLQIERRELVYRLGYRGTLVETQVLTPRAAQLLAAMPRTIHRALAEDLRAPMPGLLSQLFVAAGDEVKSGQQVAVVEAMKMANVLCAERDGRVAQVLASVGQTVTVDQRILQFE